MHCLGFGWSVPVSVGKVPVSDQINLEMKKDEKLKVIFASDMKKKWQLEDKDTADDEIGKEVVEEEETMDKEASTTMLLTKGFFSDNEDNNCGIAL